MSEQIPAQEFRFGEGKISGWISVTLGLSGELRRYLALHMAEIGLADWRFEPAADDASTPNRVVWTFKLNPYAGGQVRSHGGPHMAERTFGVHRPITIEARLYLNGEYQTLVEGQASIQGGPNDPNLAAAVTSLTRSSWAFPALTAPSTVDSVGITRHVRPISLHQKARLGCLL